MIALEQQRLAPFDALRYCGILLVVIITGVAGVSGGMPFLLMVLALVLSVRVYCHPEEAIVAGPMFLLAANVFLPSSARFGADAPHPVEIVYWAAGSLPITFAPFLKTGLRPLWRIPASLKAFLAAALVASAYGWLRGNDPSYVLRQLYGALLLVAYFALALAHVDEENFARVLKRYSVPCVIGFLAYYVVVFGDFGVHREITTLGTQTVVLAIFFAARPGRTWRTASAMMLIPSLFLIVRRDLAAFALGLTMILALCVKSKLSKACAWCLAAAIITVSLVPTYVSAVLDTATNTKFFDELIPQGGRDSNSIEDRAMQLVGAGLIVSRSPLLGQGMGGELEFESVQTGDINGAYIDNGWAYLLTKMGFIGFLVFGWFVVNLLRWVPGNSVALSAALLAMILLVMFAEPVFFQFTTSPFVGAMAGLLYSRRRGDATPAWIS